MEQEIWRKVNEEGFEDLYEISNLGRGRSLDRYVTHNKGGLRLMKGKIMGQHKDLRYLFMVLTALDHTHINRHYHLLVAKAFPEICGEWFEGAVVHHKDFNPYNNRADNLQVMTDEEHKQLHINSEITMSKWKKKKFTDEEIKERKREYHKKYYLINKDRISKRCRTRYWSKKDKEVPKEKKNTATKPIIQYTLDMEFVAEYPSISEAARQTNICRKAINNCVNQKVCNKNGYTWVSKTAGGYIWKYKNN